MNLNSLEFPISGNSTIKVPERAEPLLKPDMLDDSPEAGSAGVSGPGGNVTFGDILDNSLRQVNADQVGANSAVKDLLAGRNKNIHETMLALEKADLSLKLAMQVRNKALDAYREIMRMQV